MAVGLAGHPEPDPAEMLQGGVSSLWVSGGCKQQVWDCRAGKLLVLFLVAAEPGHRTDTEAGVFHPLLLVPSVIQAGN